MAGLPSPPPLIMGRATLPAGVALPSTLEPARIACLPATAYYIPNFISEDEERLILDKVRPPQEIMRPLAGPGGLR